jgi:hypothetical protein
MQSSLNDELIKKLESMESMIKDIEKLSYNLINLLSVDHDEKAIKNILPSNCKGV